MPPISDHLLLDAQPAIRMPTTTSEVTAVMYRMPTLRSAAISTLPKGTATKAATNPVVTTYGASLNRRGSASVGTISSFIRSFRPSASHCRMPCGPTRFGPMRDWIRAQTRRSMKVVTPATLSTKPKMTIAATSTIATA
jgi:hypothetical protein